MWLFKLFCESVCSRVTLNFVYVTFQTVLWVCMWSIVFTFVDIWPKRLQNKVKSCKALTSYNVLQSLTTSYNVLQSLTTSYNVQKCQELSHECLITCLEMARGQTVVQRYANNTVGDCPETTKNNYQFGSVQKCQDKCQPSVNKLTSVRLVSYRTYRFPGLLGTSIYAMRM